MSRRPDKGVVLILALLVMTIVVTLVLSLGRDAKVEVVLASERVDDVRLRVLIDSALQRAMAEGRNDVDAGDTLASLWRDNENELAGMELNGGRVWLFLTEPDPGDGVEVRYGMRDTASYLDVNIASRDQLLKIPGITDEAVDGIIDWRDDDDDTSESGAESTYYVTLDPPYQAKNAPIENLEELLRVKGIDDAMFYGEDRNRNGILDPGEDDGDRSFPPDDSDGELDRGLIDYLTVFSRDLNRTHDNKARASWAETQPGQLQQRLQTAGMDPVAANRVAQIRTTQPNIGSLGELVVRVGISDAQQVAILIDQVTLIDQDIIPGRININTCPQALLEGLPGMTEDDVSALMTARLDYTADLSSPAWALQHLPLAKFAQIVDLITTRSDQFLVQAVAILDGRQRFRRVEVLIDRNFAPVRILVWRDLTALGFPFPEERGEDLP